jgi:peptide/nickel transport system substrate-binding protein
MVRFLSDTAFDRRGQMLNRSPSLLIAIVTSLLIGCVGPQASPTAGSSPASQASVPRQLVIAIKGDPPTLSDKINSSGAGGVPGVSEVERLIAGALTVRDDKGVLRPSLAVAEPTVENGLWKVLPDGRMEITWTIRAGAQWHDGTPFTTDDLLFTSRISRDRDVPQLQDRTLDQLESVDVVDKQTIVSRWRAPYIEADALFSHTKALPLPQHLLGEAYANNKATIAEQSFWTRDFVGSGPYKLKDWVAGSHLILTANDSYVLGRPKIDTIEVKFIPDPNTLAANILAAAVDLTMGRGLDLEQASGIQSQRQDVRVIQAVGGCLCAFPQYLNPNPAVIADAQFRRALSHATERQAYADSLQNGLVPEAQVFLGPNEAGFAEFQPFVTKYEFDPRKTAQMIEALGFTRGSDNFFRDASGQRLTVEMRTTPNEEIGKKLLFAVADSWQRAGIVVEPIVIPPQQATDREWRANFPGFDMVNQSSTLTLFQRFHGKESSLPENEYRGNNRMRYHNAELDGFIDRYFLTIPWNERVQVAGQAIQHITSNAVALSLLYNASPVIQNSRLENVAATAVGWNSHEWVLR